MLPNVGLFAGHGGSGAKIDPGAVANNTTEHEEMKKIVLVATEILKLYPVKVTPIVDGYTLLQKIQYANKQNFDFTLELHMDAASASASGASIYYLTESKSQSVEASQFIKSFCAKTTMKNRGAKGDTTNRHGRLGFVRDIKCKSFLMETGFITNQTDLEITRKFAAYAIVVALLELLHIPMNTLFTDVPANHPYFEFIKWSKDNGIAKGFADGSFHPDEAITAGRLMAFLKNYDTYRKANK